MATLFTFFSAMSILLVWTATLFVVVPTAHGLTVVPSLKGISATSVKTATPIELESFLAEGEPRSMLILGTYAADFNAIEYAQRLRYYLPRLKEECGISKFGLVLSCQPEAAKVLADMVDLDLDQVELMVDPLGTAAREYGVERGWLPDNSDVNPFLKLFGMLWGLGAWATLPAVIGGYIGNPFRAQPWIQDALEVGQRKGRWPDNALDLSGPTVVNKFTELPYVGEWKRRPLELATLRLQSMLGVSLAKWDELAPDQQALDAGVLTQLGACLVVDAQQSAPIFEWKDPGICAVCNFEDILEKCKISAS